MEGARLDVGAENEADGLGVVERVGPALGGGEPREAQEGAVAAGLEAQRDAERNGAAGAGGDVEAPRGLVGVGAEGGEAGGVELGGEALVHDPRAAAREEDLAVDGDLGVGVGGEDGVVLAADLAPAGADAGHRAAAVGEQRDEVGAADLGAGEDAARGVDGVGAREDRERDGGARRAAGRGELEAERGGEGARRANGGVVDERGVRAVVELERDRGLAHEAVAGRVFEAGAERVRGADEEEVAARERDDAALVLRHRARRDGRHRARGDEAPDGGERIAREERGELLHVLVQAERAAPREDAAKAQRGHPQLLAADGVREEALLRRGEQRVEARGGVRVAGEAEDLAGRERTMLNAEC